MLVALRSFGVKISKITQISSSSIREQTKSYRRILWLFRALDCRQVFFWPVCPVQIAGGMAAVSRKAAVSWQGQGSNLSPRADNGEPGPRELAGKPAVTVLSHWGQQGLVLITQPNPMATGFLHALRNYAYHPMLVREEDPPQRWFLGIWGGWRGGGKQAGRDTMNMSWVPCMGQPPGWTLQGHDHI